MFDWLKTPTFRDPQLGELTRKRGLWRGTVTLDDEVTGELNGFTAVILLADEGVGTRYTAIALHRDENAKKAHEEMGFHHGWGAAPDQLVALMKKV